MTIDKSEAIETLFALASSLRKSQSTELYDAFADVGCDGPMRRKIRDVLASNMPGDLDLNLKGRSAEGIASMLETAAEMIS